MTNQKIFWLSFVLLFAQFVYGQSMPPQLPQGVRALGNVVDVAPLIAAEGQEAFLVVFEQAVDHQNKEGKKFKQRLFLTHVGYDRPMVVVTEGYARGRNYRSELADLLNANQLIIEHRYFGASVPDSLDWDCLSIKQAADDHHQIIEQFKQLYQGKWISTGISKGGQTALYHKYFYPADVAATVPYVAPINLEQEDPRIYNFLKTVGDEDCRKKIYAYQRRLLEEREKLLPLIKWYNIGKGDEFSLGLETVFEYAVLEYSFSFWQWGNDCATIPGKEATTEELLQHLIDLVGFGLYSDKGIAYYAPHFHQAMSEAGYYGFETKGFDDLLQAMKEPNNRPFAPAGTSKEFKPALITDIHNWLVKKGDHIIYIYGALDTWSATAILPSRKADALQIMMPNRSHQDARIKNMSKEERTQMIELLERWLDMEIDF